ncbi:MAG: hypothetical protein AB7E70_19760 [Hyphomicrobiaceae bacterium]|uniref:hypothetical protein n=1 Tax=Bradyrhizobium sp. TaxID=376 RepID=UPI003D14CE27
MAQAVEPFEHSVTVARSAYAAAAGQLETLADGLFADAKDAVLQLVEIADEYGAGQAVERLCEDAERIGTLLPASSLSDHREALDAALETLLEARDQLDTAVAARDRHLRTVEPTKPQVLVFAGREFVVDTRRGELRSVDNPDERYLLVDRPERPAEKPRPGPVLPDPQSQQPEQARAAPVPETKPGRGR